MHPASVSQSFPRPSLVEQPEQAQRQSQVVFDAIIGSAIQVAQGDATHTSLAKALELYPHGSFFLLEGYTLNEEIVVMGEAKIAGKGHRSSIAGNVTISGDYASIKDLVLKGDLTITGNGNFVRECWLSLQSKFVDTGVANSTLYIVE